MTLLCLVLAGQAGRVTAEEPAPKPSEAAAELLKSMREKGILNEEEYESLYRRQAIYEMEQRQASELPGWLKDWTFGGDLRLRYEDIDRGKNLSPDQFLVSGEDPVDIRNGVANGHTERSRFRLRFGAERRLGEDWKLGFRLASGEPSSFGTNAGRSVGDDFSVRPSSDPRSANVTLGDYSAPKSIFIDRAYLRWTPQLLSGFGITAGKMANPFVSSDFGGDFVVWDHDLSPEGISLDYRFPFFDERAWVEARGAYFIVDEIPRATLENVNVDGPTGFPDIDEEDSYMYGAQASLGGQLFPWLRMGTRGSYYDLRNINARLAAALEDLGNGGGAIEANPLFLYLVGTPYFTNGSSRGHSREFVWDLYATFRIAEGWSLTPFVQLMTMLDADSEDEGWNAGFDFAMPWGTKLTAMYVSLDRNATYALFTDSDLFDGFTNAKGWYIALTHPLNRWIYLRGAFMKSEMKQMSCTAFDDTGQAGLCDSAFWENSALLEFREVALDRKRFQLDMEVKF